MRLVIQRVSSSSVCVEGKEVGAIGQGLMVLVGAEEGDGAEDIAYCAKKLPALRIFTDDEGKMNRSLLDIGGEMLLVSQFTLMADAHKGRRPSFIKAGDPVTAEAHYQALGKELEAQGIQVAYGVFGAHMDVQINNDGPVTILFSSRKEF